MKHFLSCFTLFFFICGIFAQNFEDTPETTLIWTLVSSGQNYHLHRYFIENPKAMIARSSDGRGAIWWAWEYQNAEVLAILAAHGVDLHYSERDSNGKKGFELCKDYANVLKQAQSLVEEKKKQKKKKLKKKLDQKKKKCMHMMMMILLMMILKMINILHHKDINMTMKIIIPMKQGIMIFSKMKFNYNDNISMLIYY